MSEVLIFSFTYFILYISKRVYTYALYASLTILLYKILLYKIKFYKIKGVHLQILRWINMYHALYYINEYAWRLISINL